MLQVVRWSLATRSRVDQRLWVSCTDFQSRNCASSLVSLAPAYRPHSCSVLALSITSCTIVNCKCIIVKYLFWRKLIIFENKVEFHSQFFCFELWSELPVVDQEVLYLFTGHVLACPVVNRTSVSCSADSSRQIFTSAMQWRSDRGHKGHAPASTRSGHGSRRYARKIFRGWGPPIGVEVQSS